MKKIIWELEASDAVTLGNYFRSFKSLVVLQDENNLYVFIADLHSITVPIDPKDLEKIENQLFAYIKHVVWILRKVKFFINQVLLNTRT